MRLSFYGACREVTGSNILFETSGQKIIIECGFFQGGGNSEERNFAPFAFDPASCNTAIVGHAHLDHTGRLPKLVKDGFCGQIFSTAPTKDLTELVLADAQKLMEEEAERNDHKPLYSKTDVAKTIEMFTAIPYGKRVEIAKNVYLTFLNAGHILGSAISIIEAEGIKIAYTSDLGNKPSILLDDPQNVTAADYIICESTYGGRIHEDVGKRQQALSEIINCTVSQNGILLIPSFAIERTQELLHDIDHFCTINNCQKPTFFLDSPLAEKVTAVFKKYPKFLSNKLRHEHADYDFFGLDRVKFTTSVDQSKEIESAPNPKIIIAGSGMMNGGRILHHAKRYLSSSKNSLLIVGYQAKGTLGRRLLEKEPQVVIFGQNIPVNAKVRAIGSYSAHADSPQIIDWISKVSNVKKVFLVHGENDQSVILSKLIREKINIDVEIPQQGESFNLTSSTQEKTFTRQASI